MSMHTNAGSSSSGTSGSGGSGDGAAVEGVGSTNSMPCATAVGNEVAHARRLSFARPSGPSCGMAVHAPSAPPNDHA